MFYLIRKSTSVQLSVEQNNEPEFRIPMKIEDDTFVPQECVNISECSCGCGDSSIQVYLSECTSIISTDYEVVIDVEDVKDPKSTGTH